MNDEALRILDDLLEGNRRFREGESIGYTYGPSAISNLAHAPEPRVAIVACSDSRIAPEVVFNQPLGTIFMSRVPGNVCSDSAKWMVEMAVGMLNVPLVIVMGHTDCRAIKSAVDGQSSGTGGTLRYAVSTAVLRARMKRPEDLFHQAVVENALQASENLLAEVWELKKAVEEGRTAVVTGLYDVKSGLFEVLSS